MQPLKITIRGDYWDIQIYKDKLYLWDMEGGLNICDWEEAVKSKCQKNNRAASLFIYGFSDSNYFYDGKNINEVRKYEDYKSSRSNYREFDLNIDELGFTVKQKSPFRELQADTEIHYDTIYSVSSAGLWGARINYDKPEDKFVIEADRKWDFNNIQSIKAHSKKLLLAGGSEGLFEYFFTSTNDFYPKSFKRVEKNVVQLTNRHSLFASYSFSSVYNSSDIESSCFIANSWDNHGKKLTNYGVYEDSEIFRGVESCLSWAENERVYCISRNDQIQVAGFTQGSLREGDISSAFTKLECSGSPNEENHGCPYINKENIVSAGVSQFGTIIEDFEGLTILQSDGERYRIDGSDIVRWRVYPRSKRYTNHLHVIFEDRVEIYSFSNDFKVNQRKKIFGIKPMPEEEDVF